MTRRSERGQGLVETALAAPLLVLMTLGLLQIGQVLWLREFLQLAVPHIRSIGLGNAPDVRTNFRTYVSTSEEIATGFDLKMR